MPSNPVLAELAVAEALPAAALRAAVSDAPALAPELIAMVEAAAEGRITTAEEESLLFYGLHVLAAAREERACLAVLRLLRLPSEELEELLGDTLTETLPNIVIGTFDGSERARAELMAMIADPALNEWVRSALLRALAYLTWEGRVPREETLDLLRRLDSERMAEPFDMAWWGWQDAIALLGADELAAAVEAAWEDGRIPSDIAEPASFRAELAAAAEADPADGTRFAEAQLGPIDDIVASLAWTQGPSPEQLAAIESELARPSGKQRLSPSAPVRNPFRDVGRNDPCPCGSGKKAKRCCLRS